MYNNKCVRNYTLFYQILLKTMFYKGKVAGRLLAGIFEQAGIFLEFKWLSHFYNWESETEH